ncbi:lysylphosphatidylglycerol synthase domain-containing protein [Candidatus Thiosymbion oneisti]|uniref:lysylphosphatidylglycerol synthase domain-containing protein n=1 Tax=Candidatus Thiosymbion oneisti TaxID=589554 RepID=UPI000AB4657F|nr:lysylphosphatidylglycerol synthase domain-containing protein [Candidatus Thiosymbion oneisti]
MIDVKRVTVAYLYFLLILSVVWMWVNIPNISGVVENTSWPGLLGITVLYLCSHVFRMIRLGLLALDERDKVFQVIAAHTLTAFPSSFFPFKIGEILRLTAFFHVFEKRQKALAVWLAERFGDVLVITLFILGLYVLEVSVPPAMKNIFMLFVVASVMGLLGILAVAKVFVYINRHLVLTSHSAHGLMLLRFSHALRSLELNIVKSLEGRFSGFILLSVIIWTIEILALSMFINLFALNKPDWVDLFAAGMLTSLSGSTSVVTDFGLYQSLALVILAILSLIVVLLVNRLKISKA